MRNSHNIIRKRYVTGWVLFVLGLLVFTIGILTELSNSTQPFNVRIITGFGFVFIFGGIGILTRYRAALRDEKAAKRIMINAADERTVMIRSKAGHLAFWVSMIITYIMLQYVSLTSNGSLPGLSEDALWYILSAAVVIPFSVYVTGILIAERKE